MILLPSKEKKQVRHTFVQSLRIHYPQAIHHFFPIFPLHQAKSKKVSQLRVHGHQFHEVIFEVRIMLKVDLIVVVKLKFEAIRPPQLITLNPSIMSSLEIPLHQTQNPYQSKREGKKKNLLTRTSEK